MGFRFDKPDRIRFFSSMFCGMVEKTVKVTPKKRRKMTPKS